MADTPTPSAEAIRLAAVLYWLPYAVPEWSKPDENAGVLAIAHRFDAFAAQARAAAIEECAAEYHDAIAVAMTAEGRANRALPGFAEQQFKIAERHRGYAKDIRSQVWLTEQPQPQPENRDDGMVIVPKPTRIRALAPPTGDRT